MSYNSPKIKSKSKIINLAYALYSEKYLDYVKNRHGNRLSKKYLNRNLAKKYYVISFGLHYII